MPTRRPSGKRKPQNRRYIPPTSGPGVLALPIAGIGLFVLFVLEWGITNVFASSVGEAHPGWLEVLALVPIMIIFAAVEIVLGLTAHRRGYGALWILFALPALLALIAAAVWLAGARPGSHGAPVWLLTVIFGGLNVVLLLLAVRSLRAASRRRRRPSRPASRRKR